MHMKRTSVLQWECNGTPAMHANENYSAIQLSKSVPLSIFESMMDQERTNEVHLEQCKKLNNCKKNIVISLKIV